MPLAMLRRQRHFQRWLIKGWGVFFMREFMIRRLLEAPIIRPLRDQYKRMLAVQEAALAERNEALAARDAALAERNEALAARDAALAERNEALAARDAALAEKALDYGSGRMPINETQSFSTFAHRVNWRCASLLRSGFWSSGHALLRALSDTCISRFQSVKSTIFYIITTLNYRRSHPGQFPNMIFK